MKTEAKFVYNLEMDQEVSRFRFLSQRLPLHLPLQREPKFLRASKSPFVGWLVLICLQFFCHHTKAILTKQIQRFIFRLQFVVFTKKATADPYLQTKNYPNSVQHPRYNTCNPTLIDTFNLPFYRRCKFSWTRLPRTELCTLLRHFYENSGNVAPDFICSPF